MVKIQWHEPPSYRRAVSRMAVESHSWGKHQAAVAIFGGILALRAFIEVTRPNPNLLSWPVILIIGATAALLMAYLIPWLLTFVPTSFVLLSDKGINNNKFVFASVQVQFWPWEHIESGVIETVSIGGDEYRVLRVVNTAGREIGTFGLQEKTNTDDIRQWFEVRSKQISNRI